MKAPAPANAGPELRGSRRVKVRLNRDEQAKLAAIMGSDSGFEDESEFFRLMLHREYNRRHNLPKPKAADWQSAWRIGGAHLHKKHLAQPAPAAHLLAA